MKIIIFFLGIISLISCGKKPQTFSDNKYNLINVKGGKFVNKNSNMYGKQVFIHDFLIGKFEVTQKEWTEIMGKNPSHFKGDTFPVEMVSWYDCIEFCNRLSIKDGLEPFYIINKEEPDKENKSEFDDKKWLVTFNIKSTSYRLPFEIEWEYAASGGQESKNFFFSGGNKIDDVAWYWVNSGEKKLEGNWHWDVIKKNKNRTKTTGSKVPNELGIYDMSGNVREWCNDWFSDFDVPAGKVKVQRGGGWMGSEERCKTSNRHFFEANGFGPDQGLRLCRSIH